MITKAIITELPNKDNLFKVWIPVFDKNLDNKYISEAVLCYNTSDLSAYNINDVVYVGFEDNYLSKPIILGRLFITKDDVLRELDCEKLKVNTQATLPMDTKVGNTSLGDIVKNINMLNNQPLGGYPDMPVVQVLGQTAEINDYTATSGVVGKSYLSVRVLSGELLPTDEFTLCIKVKTKKASKKPYRYKLKAIHRVKVSECTLQANDDFKVYLVPFFNIEVTTTGTTQDKVYQLDTQSSPHAYFHNNHAGSYFTSYNFVFRVRRLCGKAYNTLNVEQSVDESLAYSDHAKFSNTINLTFKKENISNNGFNALNVIKGENNVYVTKALVLSKD